MRHITLLFSTMLAGGACAQLVNGSFEIAGSFSVAGWNWQCSNPEPVIPGAPGAGDYAVRKPFSNTQGCMFENMTQEITGAAPGDVYTLSGWVMQETGFFNAQPGLYFGTETGGITSFQNGVTTSDTSWTWLSVTDTLYPGVGTTQQVILHTGLVGGPGFGWSRFDGIDLQKVISTGTHEPDPFELPYYHDLENGTLSVHIGDAALREEALFDVMGRSLQVASMRSGPTLIFDLHGLHSGVYFARVATGQGEGVIRFARR